MYTHVYILLLISHQECNLNHSRFDNMLYISALVWFIPPTPHESISFSDSPKNTPLHINWYPPYLAFVTLQIKISQISSFIDAQLIIRPGCWLYVGPAPLYLWGYNLISLYQPGLTVAGTPQIVPRSYHSKLGIVLRSGDHNRSAGWCGGTVQHSSTPHDLNCGMSRPDHEHQALVVLINSTTLALIECANYASQNYYNLGVHVFLLYTIIRFCLDSTFSIVDSL